VHQSNRALAADGEIACFSSNLISFSSDPDRAPQLKAGVGPVVIDNEETNTAGKERAEL
jgi:hypothetical protein